MRRLLFPINVAGLLWDAGMFITGNAIDAVRFYHEAVAELLTLVRV